MAYQSLALGSSANDGTGDTLRAGGDKINYNFMLLYEKTNFYSKNLQIFTTRRIF